MGQKSVFLNFFSMLAGMEEFYQSKKYTKFETI
jgi:hypothetical protein